MNAAAAREEQQGKSAKGKKGKSKRPETPERLPDGATTFHVVYDATRQMWSGMLTIGSQVFTGEKSTVFRLLAALDGQYRTT
jgi:hypothetical protein